MSIQTALVEMSLTWIGLSSVLRPRQHSIGYMGDGFYRSKDPTNSIEWMDGWLGFNGILSMPAEV